MHVARSPPEWLPSHQARALGRHLSQRCSELGVLQGPGRGWGFQSDSQSVFTLKLREKQPRSSRAARRGVDARPRSGPRSRAASRPQLTALLASPRLPASAARHVTAARPAPPLEPNRPATALPAKSGLGPKAPGASSFPAASSPSGPPRGRGRRAMEHRGRRDPEPACLPVEAAEELKDVALCLLKHDALWQWDPGFCHALGTSLVDRCFPKPTTVACSQTGQVLQSLFLLLAFSMRCLEMQPFHGGPGQHLVPASLHLHLLSLAVATCHASSYWTMSKAYQYLASWSLGQFLLVAQGDLQLLKTEARKMLVLVSRAFLEDRWKQSPLASHRERELSLQVHSATTSIQLFANDVLELFCLDCRRVSTEVFGQAMPLGKYWRLALQAEPPSAASEYAQAAAQAVLAPVIQGVRWLPRDSQALVLSQVTTAFLEVWMEHILAQKIKFSLQGALQLKRDFDLVREALQLEEYELPAEVKQLVFSLRVFQQTDNAIACLLQQPSKGALSSRSWDALQKCCSRDGMRSWHGSPGSLSNLEHLEGLSVHARAGPESWAADLLSHAPGGGTSSETYLSLAQQEWLALRLHGARHWRLPALSCMNHPSET